jgi:uncharacterized protein (UPF0147 family)
MNLQLNKDSSFAKSFERENGYNITLLGHNKKTSDFSLYKGNSFMRNGSLNQGFDSFKKGPEKSMNVFIEMAEGDDQNNDDFINLTLFQKKQSSAINKPYNLRDKSCISNFSMNVNVDNLKPNVSVADYTHNDLPGYNTFAKNDSFQNPSMLKLRPQSSIARPKIECNKSIEDPTNDKSNRSREVLPRLTKMESLDAADKWVKSQNTNYAKPGYNYNHEVENLLEDDESVSENEPNSPSQKVSQASKPTKALKPIKNDTQVGVNIRRHRKKSKKQLETLNSHFDLDKEWSLELVEKLASDMSLEKDQVYKWNWDKRKRLRKKMEREEKLAKSKKSKKRQRTF